MLRFFFIRLLQAIPVLLAMSVITLVIIQAPPGDCADYIRSTMITQGNASVTAADAAAAAFRERHGLNDPMVVQYFRWIGGILTGGDFGHSYFCNKPVSEVVAERLPATIALALTCHFLASLFGISFGIIAATRQYSLTDTMLSFVSGHDHPAISSGADHPLGAGLQAERAGTREFLFVALRRTALLAKMVRFQLGQAVEPDRACLAGDLHRDAGRAGPQHAGHAREPARHAQRAVCRDRARQGPA